jgi:hypothetical protein
LNGASDCDSERCGRSEPRPGRELEVSFDIQVERSSKRGEHRTEGFAELAAVVRHGNATIDAEPPGTT